MQELTVTQQHPKGGKVSPMRLIYGDAVVLLHYGLGSGHIAAPSSGQLGLGCVRVLCARLHALVTTACSVAESLALAVSETVLPAPRRVVPVDATNQELTQRKSVQNSPHTTTCKP